MSALGRAPRRVDISAAAPAQPSDAGPSFGAAVLALLNGRQVGRGELAMAVSLDLEEIGRPTEDWHKDYFRAIYDNPGQNASCHNTAKRLRAIMGHGEESSVGGAGLAQRKLAVERCLDLLEDKQQRCIMSIEATAGNNGHSFSLVADGGHVDVLEAWGAGAEGAKDGDLHSLLDQLKSGLTRDEAKKALSLLASADERDRDQGYTSLSIAYPSSLGFEEKSGGAGRDADANIRLVVRTRQLKSPGEIGNTMQALLTKVDELKAAIGIATNDLSSKLEIAEATASQTRLLRERRAHSWP